MRTTKNINTIIISSMAFMLVACSINPKNLPETKNLVPKKWDANNKKLRKSSKPLSCIAWWKRYDDDTLNRLINKSLKKNNTIQIAMANISAAKGEAEKIKYNWLPTMDALFGYSSFPAPGFPGAMALILPSYTLNLFSQIYQEKKANQQVKITEAMHDFVKMDVISQTASSYFYYQSLRERKVLLLTVKNDLEQAVNIYESTYQGGLNSKIELSKARSELALIETDLQEINKDLRISRNMLRYLMDENPEAFQFKNSFSRLSGNKVLSGQKPLSVIDNHPEIKEAASQFFAETNGVSIALSNFLPSANLSLARGNIGKTENSRNLGQAVHFNQAILQGPMVNMSLFGELNKSKGIKKASFYAYIDRVRKVLREVDNSIAINQYYRTRYQQTKKSETALNKDYQLQNKLYQQGIISYLKLLNIKTENDRLKLLVNQNKLEELLTIVQLYQNLAVGYDVENPQCQA